MPPEQGQGNPKEDAAQTLSNLAQGSSPFGTLQYSPNASGLPGINDPGPSSHPRGPPNLGQLSAVAMQAAPVNVQTGRQDGNAENASTGSASAKEGDSSEANQATSTSAPTGGRRSGRSATMGSDEWSRQRKDNHVGVLLLLHHISYVFLFYRKKLSVDAEEILTKASTNWAVSSRADRAKKPRAPFSPALCNTFTI